MLDTYLDSICHNKEREAMHVTYLASMTNILRELLEEYGCDPKPLFDRMGIDMGATRLPGNLNHSFFLSASGRSSSSSLRELPSKPNITQSTDKYGFNFFFILIEIRM